MPQNRLIYRRTRVFKRLWLTRWLAPARQSSRTAALLELTRMLDVRVPWQVEMLQRAETLIGKLASGAEETRIQLELWEEQSRRNLGLNRFLKRL